MTDTPRRESQQVELYESTVNKTSIQSTQDHQYMGEMLLKGRKMIKMLEDMEVLEKTLQNL
jgi:hypothetical protein